MDLLIILTYAALCVAVFKLFRIPVNKWTLPTAVLGGIVLVGTLILLMNYNHPFTRQVRQAYVVTPIVSEVRARVIAVNAEPNEPLDRYQSAASAFSRQDIDVARQQLASAQAIVEQARAALERARAQEQTDASGIDPLVVAKQAELREAQLDLENTVIRAPTDGYLTQLAVRPGMMAVPLPLRPLGVFLHDQQGVFTAAVRQQALLRIEPGFEAELVFDSLPGQVYAATVKEVLPAIAESQLAANGQLIGTEAFTNMQSRALVTLELVPDQGLPPLPLGVSAQVAIYSDHFHHVAIMRRVLLRMLSWQHYLYLDH
ncbi:HlyD family secretion protein [Halomonas sp. 1390]|uniref:HlyD family secretion protein n=1 Tax=Halomonas sp. B23F22_3 TaxID=3459516 RepID=UPI00373E3879